MSSIADVIGWKFNHQPGMRCAEVDGVITIIEFPGGIPTQIEQDQWTAEYAAAVAIESGRLTEIDADPQIVDLMDKLRKATLTQISTYVDTNVIDLASARTLFKRILAVLSVMLR